MHCHHRLDSAAEKSKGVTALCPNRLVSDGSLSNSSVKRLISSIRFNPAVFTPSDKKEAYSLSGSL